MVLFQKTGQNIRVYRWSCSLYTFKW